MRVDLIKLVLFITTTPTLLFLAEFQITLFKEGFNSEWSEYNKEYKQEEEGKIKSLFIKLCSATTF